MAILDPYRESQEESVKGIIESMTKTLLENEKVDRADIEVQMRLRNVKDKISVGRPVQFFAYVCLSFNFFFF